MDRETARFKRRVSDRYAELVYGGRWHTPLREALDGWLDVATRSVTGTVTMRLHRGSCTPIARSSPWSLYREDLATFDEDAVYDQGDAGGFIRLSGLPDRVHARVHRTPETVRDGAWGSPGQVSGSVSGSARSARVRGAHASAPRPSLDGGAERRELAGS